MQTLFIAVPTYDGKPEYTLTEWLCELSAYYARHDTTLVIRFHPFSPSIAMSRAILFAQYIDTGLDSMLYIDADMRGTIDNVVSICNREAPVVSGVYMNRHDSRFAVVPKMPIKGLAEVPYIPMGFTRIRYEAACAMYYHYEDTLHSGTKCTTAGRPIVNVFAQGYFGDGEHVPFYHDEDFAFCWYYRQIGGKIYMDGDVHLNHAGIKVPDEETYVRHNKF